MDDETTGEQVTPVAPTDSDESFYCDRIKILVPAMMAHAGSIQGHSPEARRAFLDIIARSGDMPQYGVVQDMPQGRPANEGRRGSPAIPQTFNGNPVVSF